MKSTQLQISLSTTWAYIFILNPFSCFTFTQLPNHQSKVFLNTEFWGRQTKIFFLKLLSFCLFKFFLPWDMCWRLCTSWSIPERRRTGVCRYSWRGGAASWGSYSTPPPPRIAVGDRPWIVGSPLCPLVGRSYLANQTIKKLCNFETVPESSCMEILVGILFSNKTIFSLKYSSPQS